MGGESKADRGLKLGYMLQREAMDVFRGKNKVVRQDRPFIIVGVDSKVLPTGGSRFQREVRSDKRARGDVPHPYGRVGVHAYARGEKGAPQPLSPPLLLFHLGLREACTRRERRQLKAPSRPLLSPLIQSYFVQGTTKTSYAASHTLCRSRQGFLLVVRTNITGFAHHIIRILKSSFGRRWAPRYRPLQQVSHL